MAKDEQPAGTEPVLFVSVTRHEGQDDQPMEDFTIYAVSIDGTGRRKISAVDGSAFDPVWSPDRKQIAFAVVGGHVGPRPEIFVMRADGTNARRVTRSPVGWVCSNPTWSPDSSRIAYTVFRQDSSMTGVDEAFQLFVLDLGTAAARRIGNGVCPSWSPDGRRLLFIAQAEGMPAEGPLFSCSPDGRDVVPVVKNKVSHRATWSPDGQQIAFAQVTEDLRATIWIAASNGDTPRQLTRHELPPFEDGDMIWTDMADREPVWSRDGKWIVFSRWVNVSAWGPSEGATLMKGPAAGGLPQVVSDVGRADLMGGGPWLPAILVSMVQDGRDPGHQRGGKE